MHYRLCGLRHSGRCLHGVLLCCKPCAKLCFNLRTKLCLIFLPLTLLLLLLMRLRSLSRFLCLLARSGLLMCNMLGL